MLHKSVYKLKIIDNYADIVNTTIYIGAKTMGLAASQGRFLCLTARNNDLVYEGQQISQERVSLAEKTQEVAQRYSEAMNNRVMQATVIIDGTPTTMPLTYELLTSQDAFSGLGMRLVDLDGNVVVPGNSYYEVTTQEENRNPETKNIYKTEDFISQYMPNVGQDMADSLRVMSMDEVIDYYNNNYDHPASTTVKHITKENSPIVRKGEHTVTDEMCLDPKYLQEMLNSGQWIIEQKNGANWDKEIWQASNKIIEVYDTSDDAAAEAEYEADMMEIQRRDKVLELRLEEVETEQNSVETELESVKKVIDENVENSFKTFA